MRSTAAIYRALVRLYPRGFRRDFGDELVQMFVELSERHGPAEAWRRTVVDLAVTVPRYRLETIMSARRSSTAIWLVAIVGAVVGVVMLATGAASVAALLLILLAACVALAQRSQLARSLRPDTASDRRRLWIQTAIGAVVALASLVIGFADLADEETWPAGRVIVYNLIFFTAALTAVISFATALRRPRVA